MATRVSAASTMLLGRRRAAAIPLRIALNAVSSRNVRSTSNLSEIFGANISKANPAWTSNSRRPGEIGVVGHAHVARFPRAGDRRLHLFQDVGRVRIFGCDPK